MIPNYSRQPSGRYSQGEYNLAQHFVSQRPIPSTSGPYEASLVGMTPVAPEYYPGPVNVTLRIAGPHAYETAVMNESELRRELVEYGIPYGSIVSISFHRGSLLVAIGVFLSAKAVLISLLLSFISLALQIMDFHSGAQLAVAIPSTGTTRACVDVGRLWPLSNPVILTNVGAGFNPTIRIHQSSPHDGMHGQRGDSSPLLPEPRHRQRTSPSRTIGIIRQHTRTKRFGSPLKQIQRQ